MISNISGVLNINKPLGITSHDVVAHVRKIIKTKVGLPTGAPWREALYGAKVGHAGTLDPFATGVLLILIGSATRLMEYVNLLPKTYHAEITLGATSDTDDVTGKITPSITTPLPNGNNPLLHKEGKQEIENVLSTFLGPQQQTPPLYSAIKVKGKKLYEYARGGLPTEAALSGAKVGESVERKPRPVTIHAIELFEYSYPVLKIKITCSSGTYIRALARDIGKALKTGGYLSTLTRLGIGPFDIKDSIQLSGISTTTLPSYIQNSSRLIQHLPRLTVSPDNVAQFKQGRALKQLKLTPQQSYAVWDQSNTLIGIGRYEASSSLLHPKKVLS